VLFLQTKRQNTIYSFPPLEQQRAVLGYDARTSAAPDRTAQM